MTFRTHIEPYQFKYIVQSLCKFFLTSLYEEYEYNRVSRYAQEKERRQLSCRPAFRSQCPHDVDFSRVQPAGKRLGRCTEKVRKSYVGSSTISRLNNLLQKKKAEAMDILLKLHESGQLNTLSVSALRDRIARQNNLDSFYDYAQKQVDDLIAANRIGTARCYKGVIAVLKTFTNDRDLKFQDIGFPF